MRTLKAAWKATLLREGARKDPAGMGGVVGVTLQEEPRNQRQPCLRDVWCSASLGLAGILSVSGQGLAGWGLQGVSAYGLAGSARFPLSVETFLRRGETARNMPGLGWQSALSIIRRQIPLQAQTTSRLG